MRRNMFSDCIKPLAEEYPDLFEDVICGAYVGPGWVDLVREACEGMKGKNVRFVQIKEKFAGLRIYVESTTEDNVPEVVHKLLGDLEDKSLKVCEECGKPGNPQGKFWIKTVCGEHAEEK